MRAEAPQSARDIPIAAVQPETSAPPEKIAERFAVFNFNVHFPLATILGGIQNMRTVRARSLAAFIFIGLIVGAMAIFATLINRSSEEALRDLARGSFRLTALADLERTITRIEIIAQEAVIFAARGDIPAADIAEIERRDAEFRKVLPGILGPHSKLNAARYEAELDTLKSLVMKDLRAALKTKDRAVLEDLDQKIVTQGRKIIEALGEYRHVLVQRFETEANEKIAAVSAGSSTLDIAAMITVLAIVALTILSERLVLGPLRGATAGMQALSSGNVDVAVQGVERQDEIGELNRALVVFIEAERQRRILVAEQLAAAEQAKQMASDVRTDASQVAGATSEATQAIQQIAYGVQQQVSALTQVGTAITQSVRAIAEINSNAMTARKNAGSLQELSREGRNRVSNLAQVVARSAEASEQIRQITQVIDGISRKTNLLSLNAQIEAANAGEVGRGFAVVANEVQTLADNVARSAGEIASSVEQIIADVKSISGSADAVNEIISEFEASARSNAELMTSVSAAVEETDATVTQINASMEEIGQISRSNAASTEELSATMTDLSSVASRMRQRVSAV